MGFAAETQKVIEYGRNKLVKKGVDMIVANDVADQSIGFNADDNQVTLITNQDEVVLEKQSKIGVAVELLARIQNEIK